MKINLTANDRRQEMILSYLQENASETLAEKINNGVPIEKDGKRLINKKTLNGFAAYATEEARKSVGNGATGAFIDDPTVYGWAIHYFEEDSIEGSLYNEDGTKYKPIAKAVPKVAAAPIVKEPPKPKQASLFDLLSPTVKEPITEQHNDHEPMEVDEETGEVIKTVQTDDHEQVEHVKPNYARYLEVKKEYKDLLLFQRLGDFYEVFGKDAKTAAEALGLTLTGRDVGLKERIAMSGIPYHAADMYFAKLIQKGFAIAVIEGDQIKTYPQKEIEETRKSDADIDTDVPTVSGIINELQGHTANLGEKADDIKRAGEILQTFDDIPEEDDPLDEKHLRTSFDKETMLYLYDLLDGKMDIA